MNFMNFNSAATLRPFAGTAGLRFALVLIVALSVSGCKMRLLAGASTEGEGSVSTSGSTHLSQPAASLLGTPAVASTDPALNVTVDGSDVTQYRYALGDSSLGCSTATYSAPVPVSTPITDAIASPGVHKLCVLGGSADDIWQAPADAVTHIWSKYIVVTAAKVYPTHGNWNEYVKDDDRAADQYSQSDDACDYTETGPYTCIHGGELRKFVLTGVTSCTGLTLTETLGAFDWECKVKAGTATFFSKGLKSTTGLKTLLNATSWKSNSVTINQGAYLIAQSVAATWAWTNPVVALPNNSATTHLLLDGTDDDAAGPDDAYDLGTIFTLSASLQTPGYELGRDRMAIVTLGGAVLSYTGAGPDNCGVGKKCLIVAGEAATAHQLWFEGTFDGDSNATTASHVIRPWSSYLTTVKSSVVRNALEGGLYFRWGLLARIRDVEVSGATIFPYGGGDWNTLENFSSVNNGGAINTGRHSYLHGCRVANSAAAILTEEGATIQKCFISNTDLDAVYTDATDTTLVDIVVHNTDRHGFTFRSGGSSRATLTNFVSANNLFPFNIRSDGDYATIVNGAVLNEPISLDGNRTKIANLAFSDTLTTAATTVDTSFHGNLLFLNAAQCDSALGTSNGLGAATCLAQDASTHVARSGLTTTASMHLEVGTADTTNSSDTNGTAAYSTALDWLGFDHWWRGWGRDGAVIFPDDSNISFCDVANPNCVIWDFKLKASDTALRNRTGNGISAAENEPFVSGSNCPTAVNGNRSISDLHQRAWYPAINANERIADATGDDDGVCEAGEFCENEFLIAAIEIHGDRIGDEDGLCEDNEACIYSPNFGAYQGEGDYLSNGTCTFQNGTVSGVTMYAYPVNGT